VTRVLRKVKEIKDGTNSMSKVSITEISRELYPNDNAEQEATDLVMLGSTNTGEITDPFQKQADIMVWRKPTTTSINLSFAVSLLDPFDEVLYDTLVELM